MPGLVMAMLGPPTIEIDGEAVQTNRCKAIALLSNLAVSGKPEPHDYLAALLWPGCDAEGAVAYVRRTLREINQVLGKDWLAIDRVSPLFISGALPRRMLKMAWVQAHQGDIAASRTAIRA